MTKNSFKQTPEQSRASDPNRSVWVTANAGSGKTHVLVERVIRLLLEGAEPSSILCITYTKAAAAEMSARLFKRLGQWTALSDQELVGVLKSAGVRHIDDETLRRARRLFTRALETPGGLKIQTIHAFCEKILHLFPVEAGLAPGFRILDDRRNVELQNEAIGHIFRLATVEGRTQLIQALNSIGELSNSESFTQLVGEFLSGAKGLRNLLNAEINAEEFTLILQSELGMELGESAQSIQRLITQLDLNSYVHHASILKSIKIHKTHDTATMMSNVAIERDRLLSLRRLFLTENHSSFRKSLIAKKTAEDHPDTDAFLQSEVRRLTPLFEKLLVCERVDATAHLFILAQAIHLRIEQQKKKLGVYDFDDLISRCAKLLSNARAAQWVLYKLDAGLQHILVDEAQDTSPSQWQIIKALADEFFSGLGPPHKAQRTLFVVGDRKQSIFSFQGADAAAFGLARSTFAEKILSSSQDFEQVDLSVSFRSTKEVLDAVDKVFPPTSPTMLGFESDGHIERSHTTVRRDQPGTVEIWPIFEPIEKEEEMPWQAPVDREPSASPKRRLARAIVTTIKSWIGKRQLVAQNRLIKPDDILILLQSRGPLFAMLIAELRRANVPVAGADRLKLMESLAVQDILALFQWTLIPEDDYALACVLKSPLLPEPLSEDQLYELSYGRGTKSLWSRMKEKPSNNLAQLALWKKNALVFSPYNLLALILTTCRKTMIARLGTEAKDATDALLDQALMYEQEHGPSLAGFLHWFIAQEVDLKREMEKETGEVRLMTVHGAKGLEANIVFLADAGSIPKGSSRSTHILRLNSLPFWGATGDEKSEKQLAIEGVEKRRATDERNRLLYVAMTRARDEIYVCGVGSKGKSQNGSWYETIAKALVKPDTTQVTRYGPDPVYIQAKTEIAQETEVLPEWLTKPAQPETEAKIYGLTGLVRQSHNNRESYDTVAAKRGVAIHTFLQDITPDKHEDSVLRKARRLGLNAGEALSLLNLVNRPDISLFWGPESRSEAELRGVLEDGRHIAGRVDRIVILSDEIFLLDYKSDRSVPESLSIAHAYAKQLSLYVLLLEQAYPFHKIKAALLWTQNGKVEWLSNDFLTQARDQAFAELEPEAS